MLGETFSHYRILEKLGQGGMGEVYLAEDERLGRKVALKFVGSDLADNPDAIKRFEREARAVAELSHPNIATLHDVGEVAGRRFLVFEYIEGRTLRDMVRSGPVPPEEVARIGQMVADGLAEAHSRGILHRDIKSANVMLTDRGKVKILDFGLARHEDATQITVPGSTIGTIGYMSPEQVKGEPTDQRSDLWSLGVVLFECLTGRLPFQGESPAAMMHHILNDEPEDPGQLRDDVPEQLRQCILACLRKDRKERTLSSEELRSVLDGTARLSTDASTETILLQRDDPRWPAARIVRVAAVAVVVLTAAYLLYRYFDTSPQVPRKQVLAVIDFEDLANTADPVPAAMMTQMVHTSIIENAPCRVKDLAHLKDLRRRLFGETEGPIQRSEALEIARRAEATVVLLGDLAQEAADKIFMWTLVETRSGEALGAGRTEGTEYTELADRAVADILPLLGPADSTSATLVDAAELTSHDPKAREWFYRGMVAVEEIRWDDAERAFERATAIDSTFALAFLEYSKVLERGPEAKAMAERAWEHRTRLGRRDLLRLDAHRSRLDGRNADAAAAYEKILEHWPDERSSVVDLAGIAYQRWDMRSVVELVEPALEIYPDDRQLQWLHYHALQDLGEPERALDLMHRVREEYGADADLLSQMAHAHLRAARPDSAEWYFHRANAVEPDSLAQRFSLAECAYVRGDLDRVIALHEKTLAIATARSLQDVRLETMFELITTLEDAGRHVESSRLIEELREGLKDRSINPVASTIADWLLRHDRPAEVLELTDFPFYRARALVELDSLDAARKIADEIEAKSAFPHDIPSTWARGLRTRIALKEHRPEQALLHLDGIVQRGWPFIDRFVREQRARALRQAGRLEELEKELREFIHHHAGRAITRFQLAQVLEQLDRPDEAAAEYEKFLELWHRADPGLPELEEARARLAALRS